MQRTEKEPHEIPDEVTQAVAQVIRDGSSLLEVHPDGFKIKRKEVRAAGQSKLEDWLM